MPKTTNSQKQDKTLKHLSPFRYPGGKSWFVETVRRWLRSQSPRPMTLVEPFGGGAGISLTAAAEGLVSKAVFAELDDDVAVSWETILNGHAKWLASTIKRFHVTRKTVATELEKVTEKPHERAFQCLLRNRTARGGVITKGAGLIRRGDSDGIRSRWYPETLAARIGKISGIKAHLDFRRGDGFKLISEFKNDSEAVFFVDPPYTQAARRLYTHWEIDHQRLFRELSSVVGAVLMTYDDTAEVRAWATSHSFQIREIPMKTSHHVKKGELMIAKDFSWLD